MQNHDLKPFGTALSGTNSKLNSLQSEAVKNLEDQYISVQQLRFVNGTYTCYYKA